MGNAWLVIMHRSARSASATNHRPGKPHELQPAGLFSIFGFDYSIRSHVVTLRDVVTFRGGCTSAPKPHREGREGSGKAGGAGGAVERDSAVAIRLIIFNCPGAAHGTEIWNGTGSLLPSFPCSRCLSTLPRYLGRYIVLCA